MPYFESSTTTEMLISYNCCKKVTGRVQYRFFRRGRGYPTYRTPFGKAPGFHKFTSSNSHSVFQGVSDAMNVVSVADTQMDLFEEPLFDEATSSKTVKSQTVFTRNQHGSN